MGSAAGGRRARPARGARRGRGRDHRGDREGVPDYAQPLRGLVRAQHPAWRARGAAPVRRADRRAGAGRGAGREVYVDLGRGEMRAGRSLDALLSAYRLGARVAWRRFAAAGERAGLSPRTLYLLAESIFAYIDELSGDSIEGYASEQAAAAGALQRRRQRLARLLIQDPPAAPAAIEEAASEAGWTLPPLLRRRSSVGVEPDRLAMRVAPDVLVAPAPRVRGGEPADAGEGETSADRARPRRRPGAAASSRPRCAGHRAASGPAVSWAEAALELRPCREHAAARAHRRAAAGRQRAGTAARRRARSRAAARRRPSSRRRRRRARAGAAGRGERALARPARRDARGLAAPPRTHRGGGPRAARAPADGALPPRTAARPVRRAPRGPGRPLRARGRSAGRAYAPARDAGT